MKLKSRRRRASIMFLTSFGDLAFLLNIFFMVASVFIREGHIRAKEARSPDIDQMREAVVSVVMDEKGQIWLQGQRCELQALESQVAYLITERKDKRVLLKIDKDQRQRDFGDVFFALSSAGADLVVLGQKEGK